MFAYLSIMRIKGSSSMDDANSSKRAFKFVLNGAAGFK